MAQQSKTARRPRGSLSLDAVREAAESIVSEDGMSALTMRRLAAELDAGVMTLYGYVKNKDGILGLLSGSILEGVEPPTCDQERAPQEWEESLRSYCVRLHEHLVTKRYLNELLNSYGLNSPRAYQHAEAALTVMTAAGFSAEHASRAWLSLVTYTVGFAARQSSANPDHGPVARRHREIGMSELTPAQFPHVTSSAALFAGSLSAEQFTFGLDVLLAGIDTLPRRLP